MMIGQTFEIGKSECLYNEKNVKRDESPRKGSTRPGTISVSHTTGTINSLSDDNHFNRNSTAARISGNSKESGSGGSAGPICSSGSSSKNENGQTIGSSDPLVTPEHQMNQLH